MRVLAGLVALVLMAGCASESGPSEPEAGVDSDGDGFWDAVELKFGTDPDNATAFPSVAEHEAVDFSDTLTQMVGVGVPTVQCPQEDGVSAKSATWTIEEPEGNVTGVHVADLSFRAVGAATVNDVDLFVSGPDGSLGSATSGSADETIDVASKQAPGDYTLLAVVCSGGGDVELEASGQLGWTPSNEDLLSDRYPGSEDDA